MYLEVNLTSFVVSIALGCGNKMNDKIIYRSGHHTSKRITANHPHTRKNGKQFIAKLCAICYEKTVKRI